MKALAGSILILAAAIILSPGIQNGGSGFSRACIFGIPVGIVGILVLVYGLFDNNVTEN